MKTHALRGSRFERATVILAFMALFPGFFFYNLLLGTGSMPAFLGGYFTPVSLLFVVPMVYLYGRQIRRDHARLSQCELYFGLFLAFFGAVIALNAASGANQLIVVGHLLGILFMMNALFMFKMIDFEDPAFRYPAILCLAAMTALVFGYGVDGSFRLDAMGSAKDVDSMSTYQGLARSYLVTFLPVIAFTRRLPLRILLYAAGAGTLFLNTARSEFAALLFAIPIIEFCFARQKLLFIIVLASVAALVAMNFNQLLAHLPDNRILELLDLSHSNSAIARQHMHARAMQTISTSPIFGDYASYEPGHYAHNVMSAWVDLGIFGFVYLLALLVLPAIPMSIKGFFARQVSGDFLLGFALLCVTVLLLATSHFFTDMLIGATLGCYSKYRYLTRYRKDQAPGVHPSAPAFAHVRQPVPGPQRGRP